MATKTKKDILDNKVGRWLRDHLTHVPHVQKIVFVHNLYVMTRAGLSIVDSLKILSAQMENKKLQTLILGVKAQVEKGRQLSEALSDYPKLFPPLYVSMIEAGETAGKLEDALNQVSSQMKKSQMLASHVRGALIYPAVILVAMTAIGLEMTFFVLPKIIGMFNDFHAALPLATRILIAFVKFMEAYGVIVILATVLFIFFLLWLLRKPAVKHVVHGFNLHLPIAGGIIKKINVASFTLTLSSLLSSTIPIVEAVAITSRVQTNVRYREALVVVSESLKKGLPLSEILSQFRLLFPPLVTQLILVGEETGQLEKMLAELADYYQEEVDTTMKNFSTIIEPVIILLLGLGVAGIAVAVIMPIYSLAQSF